MSPERQALTTVVSLMRLAVARRFGEAIEIDPIDVGQSWEAVVAVASAHAVLPALHEGIGALGAGDTRGGAVPADVALFLEGIAATNRRRNAAMREALLAVSRQLSSIGVEPVVLKGGAFLLDQPPSPDALRFAADLDLLVPADRLLDCVRVTKALGYMQAPKPYHGTEHHFPPLVSPCNTFAFELHTRLIRPAHQPVGVAEVTACARPAPLGEGTGARQPSMEHRIVHALAHLGLNHASYLRRRVRLRDLLDLSVLTRMAGGRVDWSQSISRFPDARSRIGARGLVAVWQRLMKEPAAALSLGWRDRAWAALAVAGLEGRGWRNILMLPADFRVLIDDPAAGSRLAAALRRPARIYDWTVRRQRGEQGQPHKPRT